MTRWTPQQKRPRGRPKKRWSDCIEEDLRKMGKFTNWKRTAKLRDNWRMIVEEAKTHKGFNVHAVLVSESWLKPNLLSTSYPLPGFVFIRNDRLGRRGGGVAIYLRSDFPYKILATSSSPLPSAEFLFLEVSVKGAKAVVGVVYCPPSVDYFTDLESVLESLGSEYAHYIIMGDFNTNLLAPNSPRTRKLLHVLESSSLHILPLQATHRSKIGDDSWLDLILTSNLSLISCHGQYTAPGFSHHDLIFLSYILKPPKPKPKILHRRCFARMDAERLVKDALDVDWTPLMTSDDVDHKILIFNNMVNILYNRHAPVKKVRVKRPPAPWMTELIRIAMRRRDRAFRKFKKDRTDENWSQFKTARNRCNTMIRNAKRRHILNNISSSSSADIWKFLGTLGIGKSRHLDLPNTISFDALNSHFCTSSSSRLDYLMKQDTLNYIHRLTRPDIKSFGFVPVDEEEVKKIILSIKSKAVGCDNISRQMIVPILVPILPVITHIINFSLYSGVCPSLWRKAYVRPLPKISSPTLPSHFRPISILPFLSKVLEAYAHKQFARFIYGNKLLSPFQSGFRPGHSTSSALLKVTGDIRFAMEDANLTVR
ncbi:uncharacterized protein LOC124635360 [Helicoverpa zea]|uniref:uncharacterized protein LOC124635360 n=1 Tax=Helicoverpa zea TaxID=7113 RepID=UPI001F579F97|nr:uncharacterized protein LOC124635360 [Helicoverpa zea]